MKKILFVCLGNICRSPMAEAIFNHKIREKGLENRFLGDSAGTANYHVGDLPDPRTVETVAKNGIKIHHYGQQFKKNHAEEFDYLIAMDRSNQKNMLAVLPDRSKEVHLMRDFDPVQNGDVPDPYYGGINGFDQVFEILDRSIDKLIDQLLTENPDD